MNGPRPQPLAAFVTALLLAVPAASAAQPRTAPTAKTTARPAPAAVRPTAAAVVAPAAAPFEEKGPWRIALVVGREADSDSDLAGVRVQAELERDLVKLGARGQLSFVAAAGWWHATDEDSSTYTVPLVGVITEEIDYTVNLYEVIPSFRASFALKPRLRLFAEVGAGGSYITSEIDATVSLGPSVVGTETQEDDSWAGVLRLSAGGSWQLNDRFRIGVQLPTIHRRYGKAQSQSLTFSAMAAYAF